MTNKVYDKIKKFIKDNYKILIVYSILIFLFTFKIDYEIYTPGGLSDLNDRIEIDNEYKNKGTFNLTYVNAKKGIIPFVLLSKVMPSWDLVSLDDERIENEDYEDILKRGQIDLENVNEIAIKVAFEYAKEPYKIDKNDLTVYYVFESAKTDLKVGDIIKKVDGKSISTFEDLTNIINEHEVNDTLEFSVINNGKEKIKTGTIYESDGKKLIGMYLVNAIKVSTDRTIKFNYSNNESGASGGLMSTLEIYNSIVKEDITKGKAIAGTGTMNLDGSVGEIGGVKYKLSGAVKNKADVFIVPAGNYEEAEALVKENNYKIKLIKAETFEGVLESLKNI